MNQTADKNNINSIRVSRATWIQFWAYIHIHKYGQFEDRGLKMPTEEFIEIIVQIWKCKIIPNLKYMLHVIEWILFKYLIILF